MPTPKIVAAAVLAVAAPLAGASAAPQVLGLVASAEPAPLTCEDGVCRAELSAFCLQEHRDMPAPGTAYRLVDAGKLTLVARGADGREISLPAGDVVRLATARAQFAITVTVPADAVAALGGQAPGIRVDRLASAAPVPVADDPDPLSAGELAAASGAMRELAATVVDGRDPDAVAAGITNRLINELPRGGARDPAWRGELWQRAVGKTYALTDGDLGVRKAAKFYEVCQSMPRIGGELRRCLEYAHDGYMGRLNIDYWKVVGGGS